jgi:hypothetical protein
MVKYLGPVVMAALTWTAPISAQGGQTAEAEVLAVVNGLFEGMRRADSTMVRPFFHAKARLISVDLRGAERPAQVEESVEGFIQSIGRPRTEVFDERLSNVKTMIDGSLASVWADYKFYRGTMLNHCGVDHFLLVKEGAAWKIIELADTRRGC